MNGERNFNYPMIAIPEQLFERSEIRVAIKIVYRKIELLTFRSQCINSSNEKVQYIHKEMQRGLQSDVSCSRVWFVRSCKR